MRATQRLTDVNRAYVVWCTLWPDIKHSLQNGIELEVEVRKPKRNNEQNARLHATIDEIAKVVEWAGKLRDAETWKRLLVASWLRATGSQVEVLPALDGHGVDLVYAPTSSLTKDELSDLLEFVESWAAVHVPAPEEA
jgi:NinB protein